MKIDIIEMFESPPKTALFDVLWNIAPAGRRAILTPT